MNHEKMPPLSPDGDDEAPPEDFLAALLTACGLAFADGAPAALHRALDLFARAALLEETRPEPHLGLAVCYANLGDEQRAIRHYDACLERGFGSGDYPRLVYEYDGSDGETWVVDIGLDHVLVWRAACHLSLEKMEAARRDVSRVSAPDDRDLQAEVSVLLARIHLHEGDVDAAQQQLGRALGFDPEHPDGHFVRGLIHERRGRLPEAMKAFSRAIRLDAYAPEFRIARARVCAASGDPRHAQADLQKAEALLAQQLPQPDLDTQIARLRAQLERARR